MPTQERRKRYLRPQGPLYTLQTPLQLDATVSHVQHHGGAYQAPLKHLQCAFEACQEGPLLVDRIAGKQSSRVDDHCQFSSPR